LDGIYLNETEETPSDQDNGMEQVIGFHLVPVKLNFGIFLLCLLLLKPFILPSTFSRLGSFVSFSGSHGFGVISILV
jgi:hypothetical protein